MLKTINIMGIDYEIKEVPHIESDFLIFGRIGYEKNEILIREDLSNGRKIAVLFHEIVHGILESLGDDYYGHDEQKVQALSRALCQTLKPYISITE